MITDTDCETAKTGLSLLREPFEKRHISKLPKGTKKQNSCPPAEKKNCKICGGWHHPNIIHLDYVGHAALTDRLLDADPKWYWEPVSFNDKGLPSFDDTGGLWIRLFVDGHSRLGYGHAESSSYKEIGSREKEVIGDALRNAAMRFGAALDLWHKGDLHAGDQDDQNNTPPQTKKEQTKNTADKLASYVEQLDKQKSRAEVIKFAESKQVEMAALKIVNETLYNKMRQQTKMYIDMWKDKES